MEKSNRFFNLKSINDTIAQSTAHALPKVATSRQNFCKIVWFILFLIGLGATIYFEYLLIDQYQQFEFKTTIVSNNYQEAQFPSISICLNDYKLLSCKYEIINDCSTEFITYFDLNNGKCIRFNSGFDTVLNKFNSSLLKWSKLTGSMNGLRLYFETHKNNSNTIQVKIHNFTDYKQNEFVNIAPGLSTNIALIETKTEEKLSGNYNDCLNDLKSTSNSILNNITEYMIKKGLSYTQNNCLDLIFINYFGLKCSIPGEYFEIIENYYNNLTTKNKECLKEISINYKKPLICPLECYSSRLFVSQSIYSLNNNQINLDLNSSSADTDHLIQLNIYFNEYRVESIRQTPNLYLVDVIGTFGGGVGLFIGGSLATCLEIFEIFYILIGIFSIYLWNVICFKIKKISF